MKCIVCKIDKLTQEFSKEHIFPDSIGGTLTIDSVCKQCNDFLGHNVDSHLVNHWLIQGKRQTLKISGKTGKFPNIFKEGNLADEPEQRIKYIFDKTGNPEKLYLVPNIPNEWTNTNKGMEVKKFVIDKKDKKVSIYY